MLNKGLNSSLTKEKGSAYETQKSVDREYDNMDVRMCLIFAPPRGELGAGSLAVSQ